MTAGTAGQERARAVVIGGGLAGISAALALADKGWSVTLLEARSRLGGATYSFIRDGRPVDTGQHVLLRCYTAHRGLLERLGVSASVPVQPRFAVPVLRPGRDPVWLRRSARGRAPVHLLRALLRYRLLSPAERVSAARAALALREIDQGEPANDRVTFTDWLTAHGQTLAAVDRLWLLICLPALNLEPAEASLSLAAKVFRTALLDDATAADIAVPQVPLGQLHDTPARVAL